VGSQASIKRGIEVFFGLSFRVRGTKSHDTRKFLCFVSIPVECRPMEL